MLKERIRALPDAPQLQHAELAGDVLTMKDYPNLWRPPVVRGMALVGDAMLSVGYLWRVGCGWAFQTGAWLAEAVGADLKAGADLAAGLARYEKQCSALSGHRFSYQRLCQAQFVQSDRAVDVCGRRQRCRHGASQQSPGRPH